MSRLSIREYKDISHVSRGIVPVGEEPGVADQVLNITGSSGQSAVFDGTTRFVRIHCDVNCSIQFGTNPVAVLGQGDMVAGQTEYFGIVFASNLKVAVIAS